MDLERGTTNRVSPEGQVVEGFADFYSMWISGDKLTTFPFAGDHGLENNTYQGLPTNPPPGGDGVRVESAVAAFLYDIVDGPNEPDGTANEAGGEEWWDTLIPAGSLTRLVRINHTRALAAE